MLISEAKKLKELKVNHIEAVFGQSVISILKNIAVNILQVMSILKYKCTTFVFKMLINIEY